MLQIHDIIENFPKDISLTETLLIKSVLEKFDGGCFNFGEIKTRLADDKTYIGLVDYAYEVAQGDEFAFGYDAVSYCWEAENALFNCICSNSTDKGSNFTAVIFLARKQPFKLISIVVTKVRGLGKLPKQEGRVCLQTLNTIAWSSDGRLRYKEQHENYFRAVVFNIIALTMMKEAKHFRTRKTEVGDKLNKKREKRGLPKIMPFHTVYFEVDGREYNADGIPRGPGAQKSMHWRRGHFRRLSTGKTVHVRPCMVNDFELGIKATKPLYKIREKEPVE